MYEKFELNLTFLSEDGSGFFSKSVTAWAYHSMGMSSELSDQVEFLSYTYNRKFKIRKQILNTSWKSWRSPLGDKLSLIESILIPSSIETYLWTTGIRFICEVHITNVALFITNDFVLQLGRLERCQLCLYVHKRRNFLWTLMPQTSSLALLSN